MRLRSGLGACLVAVGLIVAIAVLRTHSAPTSPVGLPDSQPAPPPPVVDARALHLTADFRHTTLLPTTVRFADDPNAPPGFVFRRYMDTEGNRTFARYTAQGLLVRTKDNAVLDRVDVTVSRAGGPVVTADVIRCEPDEEFGGDACTQGAVHNGVAAMVIRNPLFARIVPSDAITGVPPGLRCELQAAYPNGTLLTISLTSVRTASIPLDDTAMIKLADIPGIGAGR